MSMTKKTITYEDLNGNEVTEDFYFRLTRTECTEKNITTPGGYVEMIDRIVRAKDAPALYAAFKDIVLASYGVKSADGKRFIKNAEVRESFEQSQAYDIFMQELLEDDKAASDFLNSIMPKTSAKDAKDAK